MPSDTLCFALVLVAAARVSAQTAPDRLNRLFQEHYAWQMEEFPEMAMARGDYSHADRVTDRSLEGIERRRKLTDRFLQQLSLIPYNELKAPDQLNHDLF